MYTTYSNDELCFLLINCKRRKGKTCLTYRPQYGLGTGFAETIGWYKEKKDNDRLIRIYDWA
jgi:hypothetical protein